MNHLFINGRCVICTMASAHNAALPTCGLRSAIYTSMYIDDLASNGEWVWAVPSNLMAQVPA